LVLAVLKHVKNKIKGQGPWSSPAIAVHKICKMLTLIHGTLAKYTHVSHYHQFHKTALLGCFSILGWCILYFRITQSNQCHYCKFEHSFTHACISRNFVLNQWTSTKILWTDKWSTSCIWLDRIGVEIVQIDF